MHHAINSNPAKPHRLRLLLKLRSDQRSEHGGVHALQSSLACARDTVRGLEREPGADDEVDPALWREVMEREFPPRPDVILRRRTPAELRAIMGASYVGASLTPCQEQPQWARDPVDEAEELDALAESLGPVAWREFTRIHNWWLKAHPSDKV